MQPRNRNKKCSDSENAQNIATIDTINNHKINTGSLSLSLWTDLVRGTVPAVGAFGASCWWSPSKRRSSRRSRRSLQGWEDSPSGLAVDGAHPNVDRVGAAVGAFGVGCWGRRSRRGWWSSRRGLLSRRGCWGLLNRRRERERERERERGRER